MPLLVRGQAVRQEHWAGGENTDLSLEKCSPLSHPPTDMASAGVLPPQSRLRFSEIH
jgi:hypothetical protein